MRTWTRVRPAVAGLFSLVLLTWAPPPAAGQSADDVTFTRDVAPILQRSCQHCHRPDSVAPMSLLSYEDARPWARSIKQRTGLRDRMGVMPPWFIEKNVGIQDYKDDISLSEEDIATLAAWADAGAPRGNPADLPTPLIFAAADEWEIGEPDLIVDTPSIALAGDAPDWWGTLAPVSAGLSTDRYVESLQIKEVSDVEGGTGGRFIFHHAIWTTLDAAGNPSRFGGWPVHEVGRNPDIFDPEGGRLLRAGSSVVSNSVHLHSSGRDTKARLQIGFRFHPEGYEPKYRRARVALGNAMDIDIEAMEAGQELHAYEVLEQHTKIITFEPHLHAPGERMCLEAIWGFNVETLSCVGYDHNWVRGYAYEDGYQPLLPKGTVLHIVGYMNNTPTNTNIPDPRNWQGSGNRSVANMFIDLGMRVAMSDEQFIEEMAGRRERFALTKNDHVIGCPLCLHAVDVPSPVVETQDVGAGREPGR